MDKKKVLFVCVHNSARSQMAEAFLKKYGGDRFEVESAGLEPGTLNPVVVEAMKEVGIDISQNKAKSVFDFYRQGKQYDYVVTVCNESEAGKCPVFPGTATTKRMGIAIATARTNHGGGLERKPARGVPIQGNHPSRDDKNFNNCGATL